MHQPSFPSHEPSEKADVTRPQSNTIRPSGKKYTTVDVVIGGVPKQNIKRTVQPNSSKHQKPVPNILPVLNNELYPKSIDSTMFEIQFEVSTLKGPGSDYRARSEGLESTSDNNQELSAIHPESMISDTYTEDKNTHTEAIPPITAEQTARSTSDDIEDVTSTSVKTGSSSEDTAKFKTLVTQLNKTLEFLRVKGEENSDGFQLPKIQRHTNKPEEEEVDKEPEIIYVNIWNNVDGKLKLTGQKPIRKETFDKMLKKKDFSSLVRPTESRKP